MMPYQLHNAPSLAALEIEPRPALGDISVVIPTLGRPILQMSLYWIATGNAWPGGLIVVDQGASAAAARWMERLKSIGLCAEYVPSTQRGRSAGLNRGLERVKTRFAAVTDDDCLVAHDWLRNMVAALQQSPQAIITGRVEPAEHSVAGEVDFCVVTSLERRVYHRPQLKVHPLIGGNMGVAMAHVDRIGPFDEHPSLRSAEDSDWGYRALRLGVPIVYAPEIVVRHYAWRDASQRAARYRDYSRSQGGFYGKYLFSGDWLIPLQAGRDLLRGPVRWLRGVARRDRDMIDRGRADTLELLPGILAGVRRGRMP